MGCGIDYLDRQFDILKPEGLIHVINCILKVKRNGLVWFAPPCSSWIWATRHQTGRRTDDVDGYRDLEFTAAGNNIADTVAEETAFHTHITHYKF